MREIGGEFWDMPLCPENNHLFPLNTEWFMSGRDALRAIVETIVRRMEVRIVGLPSWCCDSMIIPFAEKGIDISFYPVTVKDGFRQNIESAMECDAILIMDYFGYASAPDTSGYDGIIIRDMTHGIFMDRVDDGAADYYFGSLRKWCGMYTGGFAYGKGLEYSSAPIDAEYVRLRRQAMEDKRKYICGGSDSKDYLKIFEEAESILDNLPDIRKADKDDITVATYIDAQRMRAKRQRNAKILLEGLDDSLTRVFPDVSPGDCPMFVPVATEKRDKLKKHLIENEVYCPIHWPKTGFHVLGDETEWIYERELSIVCDQRYCAVDMFLICELINKVMK